MLADGTVDHAGQLAEGSADPRMGVALSLARRFADMGSVLVYHAAFERERLRDLACLVPALEAPLLDVAERLVDLEAVVTDHVYHPGFHGSFSLKAVLPALVPGCGYDGLAIRDGGSAALAYERLRLLPRGPERDRLRADMLDYCARDTRGMVEIYRVLRELT
jgi:predicted RecB family nuclease